MRQRKRVLATCLSLWAMAACAGDVDELSLDDLLNTRITTASRFSQRISEAPSSASVIRGEEIRSHGWRNLAEALSSLRGFEISNATDYRYLGVRGFSQPGDYNSRILLLIDGVPSNDGIYDQAMIGGEFQLDMNLIERIEVVPGPGSALYGGNAFLAVVNVITRPGDSVARSATLGIGSAGLARGQMNISGRDDSRRHWLISASAERSAGEDRYFPQWQGMGGSDGRAHDQDGERLHRLFARYGGEDWNLHLLHGRREKDAAGAIYATDFAAPVTNVDVSTQVALRFRHPLENAWTFEAQAYAGEYRWEGRYRYDRVWSNDLGRSGWLGGSAQLTGRPLENQTWVLGASLRNDFRREQENIGGVMKGKERRTLSLYAQDDVRLADTFSLNLGGRYDRDTLGSHQFSPRGALVIDLPAATVLKLMTGKAFRPPNAYESNYSYPGTQLAGGDLRPERVVTSEIALEQAIGTRGRWTTALYRNRFSDLLGTVSDFATGMQQIRNVGNARTEGMELGIRYGFVGEIDARGSVSWQRSESGNGEPLTNTPERLAKLLLTMPLGLCDLGWETYYTGPRRDVFGARVGGQTVSHATISGRFSRDLRWQARANNLFDRRLSMVVGAEYSLGPAGNVPTVTDYGRQMQVNLSYDF